MLRRLGSEHVIAQIRDIQHNLGFQPCQLGQCRPVRERAFADPGLYLCHQSTLAKYPSVAHRSEYGAAAHIGESRNISGQTYPIRSAQSGTARRPAHLFKDLGAHDGGRDQAEDEKADSYSSAPSSACLRCCESKRYVCTP